MWKLIHRLTGNQTGPKKRIYGLMATDQATREEWSELYRLPPQQGGMQAHIIDNWQRLEEQEKEERRPGYF